MKKFFDYALCTGLLLMVLGLTSCQEEFEPLPKENSQADSITASSSTAKLIEDTCSNDGSFDNIVDESSCFNIKFPYTVRTNGVELVIGKKEDLKAIEEIFDALDGDEDILDIIFPVTITMADYTEITINGIDDLREMAKQCKEGGEDDDIECIDFVYPITLYTFDLNNEVTGNVPVKNDKDLRRFFAGLDKDNLIGIDFPITLKLYDGTEIMVSSNAELANAIENAKGLCDEDDDNDYNDDDFTKESLENYLTECPLLVKEVKRNNQLQTGQYLGYVMYFKEDGSVIMKDQGGNDMTGVWGVMETESGLLLNLEFGTLDDFNLEWSVYDKGEGTIKLYAIDGNRIILKNGCDIVNDDPSTLRGELKECSWIVKEVFNDGWEIKGLLGFGFDFKAENIVMLSNGDVVSEGTWEITTNMQGRLVMAIAMEDEERVSFEWPLSYFGDDRLKFEIGETGHRLILERNCDNDNTDEDVIWVRDLFSGSQWGLTLFSQNEDPLTEYYGGYTYVFNMDGSIAVLDQDSQEISVGNWYVYRNSDNKLEMIIRFGSESNFYPLGNDYLIVEVGENRLELSHGNDYGGYDRLVFDKK